jgi:uncharacterized protein (TIGR01777 family)
MKTVLITGGTGLLGTRLTQLLVSNNLKVIILSRSLKESTNKQIQYAKWNIEQQTIDNWAIEQADYIIHLAGASVAEKRWTKERKEEIIQSRTKTSELIVESLKKINNKVEAIISTSAIGWYGADTEKSIKNGFNENEKSDNNFLGTTCKLWEESIAPVLGLNKRLVILRVGVVLSKNGGAFVEFIKSFQFKIAAILGNGKQIVSWIHIDDACNMYLHAINNKNINGIFNCVAPKPVTNKNLIKTIAQLWHRGFYIPFYIPSFLIKIILGSFSIEVLKSTNISSEKIENSGFQFQYPTIDKAIQQLAEN